MNWEPPRYDSSVPTRINLYSDTQTKPSRGMKEAMMAAEVGDEQCGSDPTIWELCDRVAALLAKEAAMFLPSGTMCNQVAIATHCRPGDEILAHEGAHIITSEAGAPGAVAGVLITGLPGERGQFSAATLETAIRPRSRNAPLQALVSVEQTANRGGGSCWSVAQLRGVAETAQGYGIATHMDGARLLNAAVRLRVEATALTAGFDSVWLDFTKGLGAPLGAERCARAASALPHAFMRSSTTSRGWLRIMRTLGILPAEWRNFRGSAWRSLRRIWCTSTQATQVLPRLSSRGISSGTGFRYLQRMPIAGALVFTSISLPRT
jgi:threonine aldolase